MSPRAVRFAFRAKLLAVVGVAALGFLVLIAAQTIVARRASDELTNIRERYLPKVELGPQLEGQFERLRRGLQDAVGAHDPEMLGATRAVKTALLEQLAGASGAVDPKDAARLRDAVDDYYTTAQDVSRRLIAGETGETLVDAMASMQRKQVHATELLTRTTSFERGDLTAAFDAAAHSLEAGRQVRMAVTVGCLVAVLLLSLWISRSALRSLSVLASGLRRFGSGDFGEPIPVLSRDELGDVAWQANQMAESLKRLGEERNRADWLKTGQAGLAQELRGELSAKHAADRAVAFLARHLGAPAGALYTLEPDATLRLLGQYALSHGSAGAANAIFPIGQGLPGQAAMQSDIMVVDNPPPDYLRIRSGLGESSPRAIVLLPLMLAGKVTGVLEVALFRAWSEASGELLMSVRETLAIAIEVARSREAMRDLLAETQRQAKRLAAQEEALRGANEELRAGQSALRQKAEELTTASSYKSQFLANMSHELRTPLNAIIGFAELLHDGEVSPQAPQHREFMGHIVTSGRHLLQLINDVLDLAKVEAGKLDFRPEPVDLPALVAEVLAILRTTAAQKRITVESTVDPGIREVVVDPARYKQVLYNYVSNALKFTPEGGRVAIRVLPGDGDTFRLEVEDTGIGIEPEDLRRLFVEFQQIDSGDGKRHGGTGLGLALTKRLVEAQGGTVGVRSTRGQGSIFDATLPRRSSVGRPPPEVLPRVVARMGAPAVLVIEDDAADQKTLVEALSQAGYAVEVAATGAQALARWNERPFDAITLDLLLPDMSGLEVLQQIRASDKNPNAPVVVVTVVAERGSVTGFAVQDILPKPLDGAALLASLGRAGLAPEAGGLVLVVDDDPGSLKLMSTTLTQMGYRTVCERDGESALRAAVGAMPSAVVLDLMMPGMNGFEFLDRFRQQPASRRVPVIVWTVKELTFDEHALLRASAQAIVVKGGGGSTAVLAELQTFLPRLPQEA